MTTFEEAPCVHAPVAHILKDQKTLKSRGPIPIYYESLYGI